jgi:hypothetical protein
VPRDAGGLRDPSDHPVSVAPVDRLLRRWPQDQRAADPLPAAGFQGPQHRDGQRHGGSFVAFADQVPPLHPGLPALGSSARLRPLGPGGAPRRGCSRRAERSTGSACGVVPIRAGLTSGVLSSARGRWTPRIVPPASPNRGSAAQRPGHGGPCPWLWANRRRSRGDDAPYRKAPPTRPARHPARARSVRPDPRTATREAANRRKRLGGRGDILALHRLPQGKPSGLVGPAPPSADP